ncbi:hypothetical protein ABW20_dc0100721 [Dactylellina cionopaga]|nr:hypothetical protein ABW20_dc0100721 [Dactylellina cionopaga]
MQSEEPSPFPETKHTQQPYPVSPLQPSFAYDAVQRYYSFDESHGEDSAQSAGSKSTKDPQASHSVPVQKLTPKMQKQAIIIFKSRLDMLLPITGSHSPSSFFTSSPKKVSGLHSDLSHRAISK